MQHELDISAEHVAPATAISVSLRVWARQQPWSPYQACCKMAAARHLAAGARWQLHRIEWQWHKGSRQDPFPFGFDFPAWKVQILKPF
jgi:hypothetical protein